MDDQTPADAALRAPAPPGKRGAILAAARALFERYGFEGTSMDTIAQQARVSKATLYAYFASKEVLFRTTLEALAHAPRSHWDGLLEAQGPLDRRLIAVANALLRVASRSALDDAAYALVRPPVLPSQMREEMWMLCFERYDRMMRALLAREVAAGALAIDDLPEASVHFFGLMTGLPANATIRGDLLQAPAAAQQVYVASAVALFLRAYRPQPSAVSTAGKREVPGGF
ncbi:TetR/AcrR family transcriptional regulator [Xanthomonas sp. 4461]|uniref:TetR/AcrR family transcriptional regulator n=1 Tax=Xanthomonas sp. 4461 TaxID=3035313 RepID=UPI00216859C6|nr:TetR/AcrR family transcriptional regulator [Xanthomonas sp. 4461]MCS3807455.1 AcrR family transcriptional regulator [Xanthomonas sp. 4461]